MAGSLTTHVLDTVHGAGAAGLVVSVRRLDPAPTGPVSITLDQGGRGLLVAEGALIAGRYEILFHVGDYLRRLGAALEEVPFLDIVPVHFGVSDPALHYHVPLVMSRYGYSTYRGG